MTRWGWGLLVLGAMAGAFLAGRWSVTGAGHSEAAPSPVRAVTAGPASTTASVTPSAETPSHAGTTSPIRNGDAPGATAAPFPAIASPVAADISAIPGARGPGALLPTDVPALERMEAAADADGGAMHDRLELSRREPRDDDAHQLEHLLASAIARLGDRYTLLRLAPPRCTQSVCVLRAVGVGGAQNPRSDWQRLSGALFGEPWFREYFDDASTMVGGEGADTTYLTLLARCRPGECRLGGGRAP